MFIALRSFSSKPNGKWANGVHITQIDAAEKISLNNKQTWL